MIKLSIFGTTILNVSTIYNSKWKHKDLKFSKNIIGAPKIRINFWYPNKMLNYGKEVKKLQQNEAKQIKSDNFTKSNR